MLKTNAQVVMLVSRFKCLLVLGVITKQGLYGIYKIKLTIYHVLLLPASYQYSRDTKYVVTLEWRRLGTLPFNYWKCSFLDLELLTSNTSDGKDKVNTTVMDT